MNPFRHLLSQKTPLGTWLMAASPNTAEALGYAGFDFLVVDMEHASIEFSDLAHLLRAIACTPATPIVRLADNDKVLVKRAMDAGAETIMLPFIQSVEEAKAAVSYMRYPPHGVRGVAAVHRSSRFGTLPGYLANAHERAFTILQLETPDAIAKLGNIAAIDGVDAIFVGPGDLAATMGHIGDILHSDVQKCIAHAVKAATKAHKPIGIVAPNPEILEKFRSSGYHFSALASDLALMLGKAQDWMVTLQKNTPTKVL